MGRGRPVGSGTSGLEPCPEHPDGRVVKNGLYGQAPHKRQRYLCHPGDGSPPHAFVGITPRLRSEAGSCDHCENPVSEHEGPRVPRTWRFPVAQAAQALVMVGQGVSYTETAERLRVRNRRGDVVRGAQLVGNWVEVLGPVVAEPRAETSWPETVVLDSTWFDVTNRRTHERTRAFYVLGVFGYPAGSRRGRVWALHACPRGRQTDWKRLLDTLPGEPALVVCDDDTAIRNAASQRWPNAYIKLCEHHLRATALDKTPATEKAFEHPTMERLNEAFKTPDGWKAFKAVAVGGELPEWVAANDRKVSDQVSRRATLPAHHSTGALDEVLAKVREFMEPRAFCYRNAERTNRMLNLVRLRLNRADDPVAYASAIRKHLDEHGGQLPAQGAIKDPPGRPSLRR